MYGEPIPDNEKRAINIFNLLEQSRLDAVESLWTKDELEHFSVNIIYSLNIGRSLVDCRLI
jgi:hypothetical protein